MKIHQNNIRRQGFSLIELVVVVAIIAVLAALTMGALGFINQKSARDKAKVQIKLLEKALEDYQADNRSLPPSPDSNGERGDEVLYKYLYYDGFETRDSGGVVYLGDLDPENNTKSGQAWIQGKDAQARIVDPYGNPYHYRSGDSPAAVNPDFDIWSAGPDGKTNANPDHDDCLDDIRNW
ncbi:type II secretion system protein GspG [Luteolibacter marinus]|uniref:type II secretion system protein GspG n=1 Tax=Luteolibacter marinus TaxID=2776705 RepID=UPI0018665C30|nr:type II secretion system protein GspG [Luteolibacter marinus]